MSSQGFCIGQRWSNNAETELGIGIVTQVDSRTVTLFFPQAEALRQYSQRTAPLTRLEFHPRDMIETDDGTAYQVLTRHEEEGLLFYEARSEHGEVKILCESQVQGSSRMPEPLKRLLQGHFGHYRNFTLRLQAWKHLAAYNQHPGKGLIGARIALIPHQYAIARKVSQWDQYRAMLADEVGLGKTIEAGLIAHKGLIDQKLGRLLLLVPESLVHQWLVEMRRRFNLPVRVFNEDQCEAICEQQETDNPFEHEQVILCSIEFLLQNERWREAALVTEWDLLVVDEAHHLAWSPAGHSDAYGLVADFSRSAANVLLLTATPEKEGIESHFAQLQLLDPMRYDDFDQFQAQQQQFKQIAALAERLIDAVPLEQAEQQALTELLPDASANQLIATLPDHEAGRKLALLLQDRFGTGRALFRNTRATVAGFPPRELTRTDLAPPALYAASIAAGELYPEHEFADAEWLTEDPRVHWLLELLKQHRGERFLVICHHKETACALQAHLQFKGGIQCSAFHEDLTLIERDRSAAWFAANEDFAQALICSEIGSEGRNFQFCHHLVMFDLPAQIDQLEQRIGRLDRIGQQHTIQIYTPALAPSRQAALLNWFDAGFSAFTHTRAANGVVFEELSKDFDLCWSNPAQLAELIERTQQRITQLDDQYIDSRNRLLQLNSEADEELNHLLEAIATTDADAANLEPDSLPQFLELLFDAYGVESEELSEQILHVRPGTGLEHNRFPNLPEDGFSATYDRATALSREDIEFLSWDHPLVRNATDMVLGGGKGSSVLSLLKNRQVREGTLLVEAVYVVECPAPPQFELAKLLPPAPVRLLLDQSGRNLSQAVTSEQLDKQLKRVKPELITPMLKEIQEPVLETLEKGNALAATERDAVVNAAIEAYTAFWRGEIERAEALLSDPGVVAQLEEKLAEGLKLIKANTDYRLDALRIMVAVSG